MKFNDVIIVGGGVIGMSIAYNLVKTGARVTVIDAGKSGQATTASAGMLAPLGESKEDSPFVPLAVDGLRRWPAFVEALQADVETELKINGPGMLRIALNEEEEAELCRTFDWQQTFGLPIKLLCPHELKDLEPSLAGDVQRAVLTPRELHVEPKLVLSALRVAFAKHGGVVLEAEVTALMFNGDRLTAVETVDGSVLADMFVISAGAWSKPLLANIGYDLLVEPVRGQIVSYGPLQPRPLSYTIYSNVGYLVPRPDGTLLAGATTERVGFDSSNTSEGIGSLKRMASRLVPSLTEYTDYSYWAGLRPVSADTLPILGNLPGFHNAYIATGHGRNGVLLAPYTGSVMAEHILHGSPVPATFSPTRFVASK